VRQVCETDLVLVGALVFLVALVLGVALLRDVER
jgi:hypothetical protein